MTHYGPPYSRKPGGPNCGCCPEPPLPPPPCLVFDDKFIQDDGTPPDPAYWDVSSGAVTVQAQELNIPGGEWVEMGAGMPGTPENEAAVRFDVNLTVNDELVLRFKSFNPGAPVWDLVIKASEVELVDPTGTSVVFPTGSGARFEIWDVTDNSSTPGEAQMVFRRSGGPWYIFQHSEQENFTTKGFRFTARGALAKVDNFERQTIVSEHDVNPDNCPRYTDGFICSEFAGLESELKSLGGALDAGFNLTFAVMTQGLLEDTCGSCVDLNGVAFLYEVDIFSPIECLWVALANTPCFGVGGDLQARNPDNILFLPAYDDTLDFGVPKADVGSKIGVFVGEPITLSQVGGAPFDCDWSVATLTVTLV